MLLLDTVSLRPSALEIPPYSPNVLMPVEVVSSQPTPPKSVLNSLIQHMSCGQTIEMRLFYSSIHSAASLATSANGSLDSARVDSVTQQSIQTDKRHVGRKIRLVIYLPQKITDESSKGREGLICRFGSLYNRGLPGEATSTYQARSHLWPNSPQWHASWLAHPTTVNFDSHLLLLLIPRLQHCQLKCSPCRYLMAF